MIGLPVAAHVRTKHDRTPMKPGIEKKIVITETIGIHRTGEFVRVGVPFAKGELQSAEGLSVLSSEQKKQPVQVAPLSRWKDGSIKWALVDFSAQVSPWGQAIYCLVTNRGGDRHSSPAIRVTPGNDTWRVDTGVAVFSVDAKEFRPFVHVIKASGDVMAEKSSCNLLTAENNRPVPLVDSIAIESAGPLRSVLAVRGRFAGTGGDFARFSSKLHFFAGSSCVQLDFTIHNPRPSRHSGGIWDLGDPGSILFRELSLEFSFPEGNATEIQCAPEAGTVPIRCAATDESFSLYQESSGGENWLSPTHRTRDGSVPFTRQGYEIRIGETQVTVGSRATPLIWCGSGDTGVSAVLPRFWQEFPKAFEAWHNNLKVALFPGRFPVLHELQGGEQKTHTLYLDFSVAPGGLDWARAPLAAAASLEVVRHAGVIAELPDRNSEKTGAKSLLEQFITGPDEFLRKREAIDEYGWRNFGELYADHEAVYHQGTEPFVSHYNNQYDPCAGMYRMFLSTGNPLWGELANDLARHVLDIDIYHTCDDREEYNSGLFWHTDHYTSAGLATHRTFSREQLGNKDPHYFGGGPGAEHCYTTGLMLHYFLTGDPMFREAVINLAEWCYNSLLGSQCILATVKKAGRYLSMLRSADRSNPPVFPRFPLSRGTGNTINACIDAYEVSGGQKFLDRAEELIRGALHPDDDINARDLLDAENAWSYTVLLVSVAKYLGKKVELELFDEGYAYARGCLLAYASWMSQHEYPYLDNPEILEYPNETWSAQDLRKSVIFFHAARYTNEDMADVFIAKAKYFHAVAQKQLGQLATSRFTRPVALMFQNEWVGLQLEDKLQLMSCAVPADASFGSPTSFLSWWAVALRITADLSRALRETNLRRELNWLGTRMQNNN